MKKTPLTSQRRRGVALVLVLFLLVLLSGIVVAFFMYARDEMKTAKTFAAGANSRQLGDTVIQLVQAQISEATSQQDTAWASQPGMIRTWDDDGNPDNLYKLYSAPAMIITGGDFRGPSSGDPTDVAPTDWADVPERWVDINSPVTVHPGDDGIFGVSDSGQADTDLDDRKVYPIMDPAGEGLVEGFDIADIYADSAGRNLAAMPVQWLYMLEDGTLTVPESFSSGEASNFTTPPTAENRIVGRLAFWTDDETSKLNINTASEGVYWDIARAFSKEDLWYANSMPVANEFQRMQTHPAMTSLSPVLHSILPRPEFSDYDDWTMNSDSQRANESFYTAVKPYFDLSPRIFGDDSSDSDSIFGLSSRGGTQYTVRGEKYKDEHGVDTFAVGQRLTLDADRLFGSANEILFDPTRSVQGVSGQRNDWLDLVRSSRFFLTAASRAAELTPFGTPKIAMYPVQSEKKHRFLKEDLLRFVATINGESADINPGLYAFQRRDLSVFNNQVDSDSSAHVSQGDSSDVGIERNELLLSYLESMLSTKVPGAGGKFSEKWKNDTDGANLVALMVFDQIRSTIATSDIRGRNVNNHDIRRSYTQSESVTTTAPSIRRGVKGFGNHVTFSGASIIFGATDTLYDPNETDPDTAEKLKATTSKMQALLVLHPVNPVISQTKGSHGYRFRVTGASNLSISSGGNTSNMEDGTVDMYNRYFRNRGKLHTPFVQRFIHESFLNPFDVLVYKPDGINQLLPRTAGSSNEKSSYPFVTGEIDVPTGGGPGSATFDFSGGTIKVYVEDSKGETLQEISMKFDPWTGPVPQALRANGRRDVKVTTNDDKAAALKAPHPNAGTGDRPSHVELGRGDHPKGHMLEERPLFKGHAADMGGIVFAGDIVRGIHWVGSSNDHGDLRLLALKKKVEDKEFKHHPDYDGSVSAYDPRNSSVEVDSNRKATSLRNDRMMNSRHGTSQIIGNSDGTIGSAAGLTLSGSPDPFDPNPDKGNLVGSTPIMGYGGAASAGGGDWAEGVGNRAGGSIIPAYSAGHMQAGAGGMFRESDVGGLEETIAAEFEPTRSALSPVVFGSLPAPGEPGWTSLLFNPRPFKSSHFGFQDPKDHYLLEFFWLPIVEPYAISEHSSTAGKVNLNYQMWPFPHIERSTAIRGALKPVPLSAFSGSQNSNVKKGYKDFVGHNDKTRHQLRFDEANGTMGAARADSLEDFRKKFHDQGEIFRTASEVTEVSLVPEGHSYASLNGFWNNHQLTSDTLRELPYLSIYPRVTTTSNTYTVHYRVQVLGQPAAQASEGIWIERPTAILGEYRGEATIERYIDPNDTEVPDYAKDGIDATSIGNFYQWRVVKKSRFAPSPDFASP